MRLHDVSAYSILILVVFASQVMSHPLALAACVGSRHALKGTSLAPVDVCRPLSASDLNMSYADRAGI